jgi:hypothetical protein
MDDCRNCQTSTATPAEPGDLSLRLDTWEQNAAKESQLPAATAMFDFCRRSTHYPPRAFHRCQIATVKTIRMYSIAVVSILWENQDDGSCAPLSWNVLLRSVAPALQPFRRRAAMVVTCRQ